MEMLILKQFLSVYQAQWVADPFAAKIFFLIQRISVTDDNDNNDTSIDNLQIFSQNIN